MKIEMNINQSPFEGTAIETHNLTRRFSTVTAVDNLSIQVPAGSIYGFLGPNGAGKTTTIHLLLGLLEPDGGVAKVLGLDTTQQGDYIRSKTGALLEHTGLYEQLTAAENLAFYGRVYNLSPEKQDARAKELLSPMGLWERRDEKVSKWSKGMKQKLAVARALLHRPILVFLDEPTAGLDVVAANALREDLTALAEREKVTIFLTTHNMREAEMMCDKVAVIREGKLVAVGHPDELRARASSPRLEITGGNFSAPLLEKLRGKPEVFAAETGNGHLLITFKEGTDTSHLINLLVDGGARIDEVRRGKATLEEAFLDLMEEENV